ncbi:MAG: hypothetical protein GX352_02110 [Clostridiales bacterium]|nr:hypothetical protein [Clostridiales bacterium]
MKEGFFVVSLRRVGKALLNYLKLLMIPLALAIMLFAWLIQSMVTVIQKIKKDNRHSP